MGIDYSLCAILPRTQSTRMLESLGKILAADDRRRINNLEWIPATQMNQTQARGIFGLSLNNGEHDNSYCFSLHVKLERELETYLGEHRFKCFDRADSFGCMWTSVFASSDYVLIRMTAATSGMSVILQESQTIYNLWAQFAKSVKAVVAYVDLELESGLMVYPKSAAYLIPSDEQVCWFEAEDFDLNQMVQVLKHTNGI